MKRRNILIASLIATSLVMCGGALTSVGDITASATTVTTRGPTLTGARVNQDSFIELASYKIFGRSSINNLNIYKLNSGLFVKQDITNGGQALCILGKMLSDRYGKVSTQQLKIINFKYKDTFIKYMPKELQPYIPILVAHGVINNPRDIKYVYGKFNSGIANKFISSINDGVKLKLDSEQLNIMNKGFLESRYYLNSFSRTISVKKDEVSNDSFIDKILTDLGFSRVESPYEDGTSTETTFTITKKFLNPQDTLVYQVPLNTLINGSATSKKALKDCNMTIVGTNKSNYVVASFKVKAASGQAAMAYVDSICTPLNSGTESSNVQSVTTITSDTVKDGVSYVSQSALTGGGLSGNLGITILNDKTLMNTQTGSTAMILPNHSIAMIGNTIIRTPQTMEMLLGNRVYYNLQVVGRLLDDNQLRPLIGGQKTLNATMADVGKINILPVLDAKGGKPIESVPTINLKNDPKFKGQPDVTMVNENQLTKGVSNLIRTINVSSDGQNIPVTIVVTWGYSLPKDCKQLQDYLPKQSAFNINSAQSFLFNAPTNGDLLKWWNSNITLSDTIANFMYGTTNVRYFKTGYLSPSVHVLVHSKDTKLQATMQDAVMTHMGLTSSAFNGTSGITATRKFETLTGQQSGNQWLYGSNWLLGSFGRVYRNIKDDTRLGLSKDGKSLYVVANTQWQNINSLHQVVTYKGYPFYVDSINKNYLCLIDANFVKGSVGQDNKKPTIVTKNGYDEVQSAIDNLNKLFGKNYTIPNDNGNSTTGYVPSGSELKGKILLIDGKFQEVTGEKNGAPTLKVVTFKKGQNSEVYAFPRIYVNKGEFYIKDKQIVQGKGKQVYKGGNVFFSGLNSTVIDSILLYNTQSVDMMKLPIGATVYIGGNPYYVTQVEGTKELVSGILTDGGLIQGITANTSTGNYNTPIANYLNNTSVNYSGRSIPISNFVTQAELGPVLSGEKSNNTYTRVDGRDVVENKGSTSSISSGGSSAVIAFTTNSSIKYMQVSNSNQVYVMINAADTLSNGYLSNLSFLQESLNYDRGSNILFGLNNAEFTPIPFYQSSYKAFTTNSNKALREDILRFILQIAFTVGAWGFISGWIGFGLLNFEQVKTFGKWWHDPSGANKSKFWDFLMWFTIGQYRLVDEDVDFGKQVKGSLLFVAMMVIAYIAVNHLH